MSNTEQQFHQYLGLPSYMQTALAGADLSPIGTALLNQANQNPDDANVLMDLSIILQLKHDRKTGLALQAEALKMQQIYHLPCPAAEPALRLLAIMGPGDLMSNTPVEFLVEHSDVALTLLFVAPELALPEYLPEHDVAMIAVGESDENQRLLTYLEGLIPLWPRPVINHAEKIKALSRDGACALLEDAAGIVMPKTVRVSRETLTQISLDANTLQSILMNAAYPLIIRPMDSHAGRGLAQIEDQTSITEYLNTMIEESFYLSTFNDYRSDDGLFRKYRIVLIEGQPFLCHMAISQHWMVHYLNANMLESAVNRDEEAQAMQDFDTTFAKKHAQAFAAIYQRTGLEYLGIDCAETANGELLIFEIDSNMIVHAMDSVTLFPYKQPQMRKVFSAFRDMLIRAAHPQ